MTDEKFKAYFYNGFTEPELIATNLKELEDINIFDNYAGDATEDLLETVKDCKNLSDLKEELVDYDIYINPDKQDLIEANKVWFEPDNLEAYLENW